MDSRRRRFALALALLALLLTGALGATAVTLSRGQRDWNARLAAERASREELERRLSATDARLHALGGEFAGTAAVLREREAQAAALAARWRTMEREARAGERVLSDYAAGVGLIQVTVRYEDAGGRPLRYRRPAERRPWRGVIGPPPVGLDGDGLIVTTTFLGTGFLVGRDGTMLTSRHVARPWEAEDESEGLRELGVIPRVTQLRVFFPALSEPVPLTAARASSVADVMRLKARLRPGSVPVLPLDPALPAPGGRVVVLGYPAGLDLLLARVEPGILRTLVGEDVEEIADDTVDVPGLLAALARRRLIRPHASWGHLVDFQPHLMTYDVRTAIGSSGGPILNAAGRVVGVSQAVLPGFDGVTFGVPVHHGARLLDGRSPAP